MTLPGMHIEISAPGEVELVCGKNFETFLAVR